MVTIKRLGSAYITSDGKFEIKRWVDANERPRGWIVASTTDRFNYSDPITLLRDAKRAALAMEG